MRTHSGVGGSSRRLVTGSASAEGRDPGVRGQGCGRAGARCPLASGEATSHRWGDSGSCPGPRRSGMGPEAEAPSGDTAASPMPLGGWPRGARPPQPRGRPRERRGSRAPVPSLLHRSESSGGARDQPAREWLSRSRRPPCDPPGGGEPVAPSRSNESDHRRLPHPQPRGAGTALRPKAAVARATLSAPGLLPAWRLRLCGGRRWSRPRGCQGLPGLPSARPEVRGPGAGLHGRRPRAVLSETPLSTAAHRDGRKDQPVPGGPPARRKDAPGAGRPLHPVLY